MCEQHPLGSYDIRDYVAHCDADDLQQMLPKSYAIDTNLIYGEVEQYYLLTDINAQKLSIIVNGPIKFVVDNSGLYRELEIVGWDENVWYSRTPTGTQRISINFKYDKCYGFVYQHSHEICQEKLRETKLQLFEAEKELLKKQGILNELQKEVQEQLNIVDDRVTQCAMLQSRAKGINDEMSVLSERLRTRNRELAALNALIQRYENLDISIRTDLNETKSDLLVELDQERKEELLKKLSTLEEDRNSCQAQIKAQKQQEEKVRETIQKDSIKLNSLTAQKESHMADSERANSDMKRCKKRANKVASKFGESLEEYNLGKKKTDEMSQTMVLLTSQDKLQIKKKWGSTPAIVAHAINRLKRKPKS